MTFHQLEQFEGVQKHPLARCKLQRLSWLRVYKPLKRGALNCADSLPLDSWVMQTFVAGCHLRDIPNRNELSILPGRTKRFSNSPIAYFTRLLNQKHMHWRPWYGWHTSELDWLSWFFLYWVLITMDTELQTCTYTSIHTSLLICFNYCTLCQQLIFRQVVWVNKPYYYYCCCYKCIIWLWLWLYDYTTVYYTNLGFRIQYTPIHLYLYIDTFACFIISWRSISRYHQT